MNGNKLFLNTDKKTQQLKMFPVVCDFIFINNFVNIIKLTNERQRTVKTKPINA